MTEKLYYWAENLENYSSDNDTEYDEVIEIKRLNFFIGKNNAGKSRFLRTLFQTTTDFSKFQKYDLTAEIDNLCEYLNNTQFRRLMCAEKTGGFNLVNYRHSSGVYHEQETEDLHRRI